MTYYKRGTPIIARITPHSSQHLRGKVTTGDEGKVIAFVYNAGYLCKFAHGSAILARSEFSVAKAKS